MTICPECLAADADPAHCVYVAHRSCCDARRILAMPHRFRRDACADIREHAPNRWPEVRARIEALMAMAGAAA